MENYHREDGPAIEYANGDKEYYINAINFIEKMVLLLSLLMVINGGS
jgi:hypothetical protein